MGGDELKTILLFLKKCGVLGDRINFQKKLPIAIEFYAVGLIDATSADGMKFKGACFGRECLGKELIKIFLYGWSHEIVKVTNGKRQKAMGNRTMCL